MFIANCKNDGHPNTSSEKKYYFSLHVESKSTYYYTISNETETKLEYNGKKTETANKSYIGLIYDIQKDTADRYLLSFTYDTFHIVTGKDDDLKEINSSESSYDPMERLLSSLKGMSIKCIISSQGKILSTTGSQEISEKILAGMNTLNPQTGKIAQEVVSRFSGESFVKGNVEQSFELFPDSAVYIGDKWSRRNSSSNELQVDAVSKYILVSVSDGIAKIKSEAKLGSGKNAQMKVMGYDINANLSGEQTGECEVEEKTGIVLKNRIITSLQGTIQLLDKEVPVKINIIRKIAAKKI